MSDELQRWDSLADALATDEPLSPSEQDFVDRFDDPEAARERQLYQGLAQSGTPAPLLEQDRQRGEVTLAEFRRASAGRRRTRWLVAVGSAVVAAAAAFVLWTGLPAPTEAVQALPGATISSGTLMLDGVVLAEGDALPVDRWVVARGRACVEVRSGRGCISNASRVRVRGEDLELETGALEFSGSGTVIVGDEHIEASDGAFRVTAADGDATVEVTEGGVRLGDRDLRTGQHVDLTESGPPGPLTTPDSVVAPEPEPEQPPAAESRPAPNRSGQPAKRRSPGELLSAARQHIAQRERGKALAVYGTLQRQHPRSTEAHAANVSIGKLELQRGKARAALRAYSRYLGKGGPLAAEAHWGKVQSLHRLGRTDKRDQAIEALRAKFPKSVYLRRAEQLQ